MAQRSFALELKSLSDAGEFVGLASTYGNVDQGGDIVHPGAFTKTIQASKQRPLLWKHRDEIGLVTLRDTPAGLEAHGKLSLGVQLARDVYTFLQDGVAKALSIGYTTVRADYSGDVRNLRELKLYEVSLLSLPMNEQAVVTSVKSASAVEVRAALDEFKRDILGALKVRQ